MKDLFKDGVFMSFEQLVNKHNIPRLHFYRHLLIQAFDKKLFASFPSLPLVSGMNGWLEGDAKQKGAVSKLYYDIQSMASPSLNHIRDMRNEDLGFDITDESWQLAIMRIYS